MNTWLITIAENHTYLIYGLLFVLACVEGPIISLIGGGLLRLGYLNFLPLYFALMMGDIVIDVILYFGGYKFGARLFGKFGKYVGLTQERIDKASTLFHKYSYPILVVSKMTNGFGLSIVTLITAGIIELPFAKFLGANLIGQFIWTGILIAVGFFISDAYLYFDSVFGKISVGAIFIILIGVYFYYRRKASLEIPKDNSEKIDENGK